MAFGALTHRGSNGIRASSGTTIAVSPSANIVVGRLVLVRAAFDNFDSTTGETNYLSCADTDGHTWTKIKEQQHGSTGAGNGILTAAWLTVATSQIGTGDSITITISTAVNTRLVAVDEVVIDADGVQVAAADGTTGTDTEFNLTLSGLDSREYLMLAPGATERSDGALTIDGDYTALTAAFTSGGAQASNVTSKGGYRIATLTGDTFTGTWTAGAEMAHVLGALYEVASGPVTVSGASSLTVTFAATTAALRTAFAAAATPLVLSATTTGARKAFASASATVTFGAVTSGVREVTGAASAPIVFGAATSGRRIVTGATSLPIVLSITTTTPGATLVQGASSLTVTFGATTSGTVTRLGAAELPIVFAAATAGSHTAVGSATLPIVLSAATAAVRTAYGATVLPLVLGVTTTPATGAVRGASSLTVTFGATTTPGAVTRIGSATLPVSFGATTTAIRTTYAAAATPLILTIDTAGVRYAYGSLVLPIVLGVTTVVAGDAPIVADLTIGATDEGPTVVVLDGDGLAVVETALHTQLVAEAGVTLVEITDT